MYKCSVCKLRGCEVGDKDKLMKVCPTKQSEIQEEAKQLYYKEENRKIAHNAAVIEARGYGDYTRLKEIVEFCKVSGYKKVGVAFCIGLKSEMEVVQEVLEHHEIEVVSVICKNGAMPKSTVGVEAKDTLKGCDSEVMCNPIGQALFLNESKVDFSLIFGLCVGHDTLVIKYLESPVSILAVKDRATGHNPMAAIYNAKSYFKGKLFNK